MTPLTGDVVIKIPDAVSANMTDLNADSLHREVLLLALWARDIGVRSSGERKLLSRVASSKPGDEEDCTT
jgi:hypothetical protein